ncbi:MAG: hypothetical protein KAS69_02090 [Planctomycetes bacterium]|nr:hypothetical protein [Planctomycetota bacterium]
MEESELNEMFGGFDAILEHLNFLCLRFLDEIGEAQFYFDTLVDFIESQERKEIQHLKEVAKKVPDNRKGDFWEDSYPYYWKNIFEENLKESFIVSLFSMLEVYLDRTCWVLHDSKLKTPKKCDGEDSIHRFQNCLNQHVPAISSLDWEQIYKLWRIRCVIAHNQGQCLKEEDKKLLKQFADKTEGISIRNGWIEIDPLFCKSTLIMIKEFGIKLSQIISDDLTSRES